MFYASFFFSSPFSNRTWYTHMTQASGLFVFNGFKDKKETSSVKGWLMNVHSFRDTKNADSVLNIVDADNNW
jgi:GTP:adenosylcobinamide-phosphate guanylyltransferase